ncbi:ribosomal protein S18 acetylase RimI-like enzyme [Paenibacillus sp. PastF-1]|nr:ribosomal protein S18 acetylase RimI-like enzyme [Paenibacillus sp. PastF-2]MDF9851438.1 ribosomal protein S18 acetylase RimI-like enzyme [Paenibacillus sp. PastM-2]MDF9858032.1 ribosomal protein S18 acetylase RimI-like enzyme [Paenibacillus sp. PastF-1]MDH6483300.1 ribosomal protein S18 acetylase RimI-like enzyme [Paenibacillus sp. PastH-2]MDH6510709.1 ribosomal protein S18 acetylase RimI-like enzyme [Paenibacillus sp. PastM-3]
MNSVDILKDIEELQQRCEQYEGISLKLNWDMLRHTPDTGGTEYLVTYEEGQLVGFIGLYGFGGEMEVCGMVRPGFRRRGIFNSLWQLAQDNIRKRNISTLLLNAPAASASASGFLKTLPLVFDHAEYQMKWDSAAALQGPGETSSAAGTVTLRPAREDESSVLIQLDSAGFDVTEEEAAEMFEEQRHEALQEHIIIELDGRPAGKMRLWTENNETWIYGFTVDQKLRGLGVGRSALQQTIERESRNYNGVNLEVALDNPNALKLYESCGFVVLNRQDYYRYTGSI